MQLIKFVCKECGKVYVREAWATKHSLYNANHYIEKIEIREQKIDFNDIISKISNLSLKLSLLERQFSKIKQSGLPAPTRDMDIKRIKPDPSSKNILTTEKENHTAVIRELKTVFNQYNNVKDMLENVSEIFLNHPTIY